MNPVRYLRRTPSFSRGDRLIHPPPLRVERAHDSQTRVVQPLRRHRPRAVLHPHGDGHAPVAPSRGAHRGHPTVKHHDVTARRCARGRGGSERRSDATAATYVKGRRRPWRTAGAPNAAAATEDPRGLERRRRRRRRRGIVGSRAARAETVAVVGGGPRRLRRISSLSSMRTIRLRLIRPTGAAGSAAGSGAAAAFGAAEEAGASTANGCRGFPATSPAALTAAAAASIAARAPSPRLPPPPPSPRSAPLRSFGRHTRHPPRAPAAPPRGRLRRRRDRNRSSPRRERRLLCRLVRHASRARAEFWSVWLSPLVHRASSSRLESFDDSSSVVTFSGWRKMARLGRARRRRRSYTRRVRGRRVARWGGTRTPRRGSRRR